MINIALLGHGVVGTGVVNVINNKKEQLKKETKLEPREKSHGSS